MISIKLNENIHDSKFFTFETSWIGEEIYDIEKKEIKLPVLNLEVQNKDVLRKLGSDNSECRYVRESYFTFTGVYKIEKKIHIQKDKKFVAKVFDSFEFENTKTIESSFEIGGMGIYKGNLYDGAFKIYASECFFTINENSETSLDFISMNEFDPINDSWLNDFKNQYFI